ncbi:MAG: DUF2147 domain-containing protein [Bacteroidales bacterium]|nr:DUF2147 domain-containing protein [Bacteroidales bacterium]
MYKIIITISLIIFSISQTFAQKADAIVGKYHLPNSLDLEIFEHNNKYFGRIIALNGYEDGQTTDYKNPNKTKRKDQLIGKVIITNLEYDTEEKEWVNGKMYGPEKGMYFDIKITDVRPKEIEIQASKYFFRKTAEWEKI